MCDGERGTRSAYLENLRADMPVSRKLAAVVRNMARRLFPPRTCCGHPGEPGC